MDVEIDGSKNLQSTSSTVPELEILTVIHPSTTKSIIFSKCVLCSPSATAIFVGGASLLHLPPKFSVTFTFTITGTEFGNSDIIIRCYLPQIFSLASDPDFFAFPYQRVFMYVTNTEHWLNVCSWGPPPVLQDLFALSSSKCMLVCVMCGGLS